MMWGVSRGSYSDYRMLCVCDSKKRAKEIAALTDDGMVEALPYFDRDPKRVTTFWLNENLYDDGTTDERYESQRTEWEFDMLYPERIAPVRWRWVRASIHRGRGGRLEVSGTDLERVRKVFGDRRGMLLTDEAMRSRREARG